jgi:hypothetical protein
MKKQIWSLLYNLIASLKIVIGEDKKTLPLGSVPY